MLLQGFLKFSMRIKMVILIFGKWLVEYQPAVVAHQQNDRNVSATWSGSIVDQFGGCWAGISQLLLH